MFPDSSSNGAVAMVRWFVLLALQLVVLLGGEGMFPAPQQSGSNENLLHQFSLYVSPTMSIKATLCDLTDLQVSGDK